MTAIEGAPVVGLCAFDIVQVPFINAGRLDYRTRIVGVGRVGGPAAYIWSDDLGKTWKQGKLPALGSAAFDVKFLDDRRGFIAAATHSDVSQSNALILGTWTEIPLVDNHAVRQFGIAFIDARTGWVGAVPHGFATTDGGQTWTAADFGNAVNKIRLLRTPGGITGYAIGVDVHRMQVPSPSTSKRQASSP